MLRLSRPAFWGWSGFTFQDAFKDLINYEQLILIAISRSRHDKIPKLKTKQVSLFFFVYAPNNTSNFIIVHRSFQHVFLIYFTECEFSTSVINYSGALNIVHSYHLNKLHFTNIMFIYCSI